LEVSQPIIQNICSLLGKILLSGTGGISAAVANIINYQKKTRVKNSAILGAKSGSGDQWEDQREDSITHKEWKEGSNAGDRRPKSKEIGIVCFEAFDFIFDSEALH